MRRIAMAALGLLMLTALSAGAAQKQLPSFTLTVPGRQAAQLRRP